MKRCSHCHNTYPESSLIYLKDQDLYFCCKGCESVYFLLQSYQIEGFYSKITTLDPPKESQKLPSAYFDSEPFLQKYVKTNALNQSSVSFKIHHIHCSACIWLIETMLQKLDGIQEVALHYTNHKATIIWDSQQISLSQIVQMIYDLGYDVSVGEASFHKEQTQKRQYYIKLIVAIFCTMNIMWIAIAQYLGYFSGMDKEHQILLNVAGFLLSTPVLFYSGSIFYQSAFRGLKQGFVGMDLLVFSGSFLTYAYSIYASLIGAETFFESVSMILTFVLIGKFLEISKRNDADEVLQSLQSQIPQSLRVYREGKRVEVLPQEVQVGERIEVLAGERIVIDGILENQSALLDEVALSGESVPIEKNKGELLISGSINLNQTLFYTASKTFEQSTLNTLIALMQNAILHKPKIQEIANALSSRFSQIVLVIAFLTFIAHYGWYGSFQEALSIAVSVIIIACPCALALATPISSIVGLSRAYQEGIIFKQAQSLETLAKVDCVCLDKTGTLTEGKPKVIEEQSQMPYESSYLFAFMQCNPHPIAYGILEYLSKPSKSPMIQDFRFFECKGVEAQCEGHLLLGGSLEFLQERGVKIPEIQGEGSVFGYACDGVLQSVFFLKDCLKPNAKALIERFHQMQMMTLILSGDRQSVVQEIASELGIAQSYFGFSPFQKAQKIEELRAKGKKIAMVGDGINDILALTQSEVGISFAQKSDVAIQSSDVILVEDDLILLHKAFWIARKTFANIKQNLALSIVYNCITIPLATLGYVIPVVAALSMSLSSIIVVLNALRMKKIDYNFEKKEKND